MKYFYDTEFIERGSEYPIEFISIGMVDEKGQTYYAINEFFKQFKNNKELFDKQYKLKDDFVFDNVISKLEDDDKYYKSLDEIKKDLLIYIDNKDPEFYAYYADYDHVVLCQLFGSMIDLPEGWPMYTIDLKQIADEIGFDTDRLSQNNEHNALSDARWDKVLYYKLEVNKKLSKIKEMKNGKY